MLLQFGEKSQIGSTTGNFVGREINIEKAAFNQSGLEIGEFMAILSIQYGVHLERFNLNMLLNNWAFCLIKGDIVSQKFVTSTIYTGLCFWNS
ncbi:hypothetical protein [Geomicrobium sp. JCM 19055]|uniref:hypothetical protein n=1 Tax=Geomicrobium sp. JCM 19055 TaxID=1460649 RepID=UPI0005A806D2|nr:hypothetical protein [Geomicrobium sp. JCM 19055]